MTDSQTTQAAVDAAKNQLTFVINVLADARAKLIAVAEQEGATASDVAAAQAHVTLAEGQERRCARIVAEAEQAHAEAVRTEQHRRAAELGERHSHAARSARYAAIFSELAGLANQVAPVIARIEAQFAADAAEAREAAELAVTLGTAPSCPPPHSGRVRAIALEIMSMAPELDSKWFARVDDPQQRAHRIRELFEAPHAPGVAPEEYARRLLASGDLACGLNDYINRNTALQEQAERDLAEARRRGVEQARPRYAGDPQPRSLGN